ncbi:transporter substrate-binding domain-containing protein [Siculibacillus lacustris]|uniref:Transporter substrate-binding domain-containing protein n=1 Tax=Siculibacillus lacustris TaxID=1549641 RepID=A0A4V2KSY6_9HYPH|nr:transporter substrate-binding domain-containing protein [Siculibacillus lacustris]TBW34866.1 transporter substrate-binding domain-containing protein [Siculibacillus lacustris]
MDETAALRFAINVGNPVLARRDPGSGALSGVVVDLARAYAREVGRPADLVAFASAAEIVAARGDDRWDVAFLAADPARAGEIAFTAPYLLIEGVLVVDRAATATALAELDRPGVRIAVGRGAAYDLFLTRSLKAATLVRFDSSEAALAGFRDERLDAAAGVRASVAAFAAAHPDLRLVETPFMRIAQAAAVPAGRTEDLARLERFLAHAKRSGAVARSLAASGHGDVEVAP